jgi:RNA polymerase sigma-70 factor (ECF subfamily)
MEHSSKTKLDENVVLMQKVADDDAEAFNCLYHKFSPVLRRLLANWNGHYTSADDLIQKIFTRLWEQRKNFRAESSFQTYLFSIARYTLNEEKRQFYRIVKIHLKKHSMFDSGSCNGLSQPEAEFHLNELAAAFEKVKSKLTDEQRQALELFHAIDIPFYKASKMVGCSLKALESRLYRARKRSLELLTLILRE